MKNWIQLLISCFFVVIMAFASTLANNYPEEDNKGIENDIIIEKPMEFEFWMIQLESWTIN